MESRQQFEEKYPLPDGMYFDNEQNAYAGTKDFWLWCTRWESWQASRESLVVKMPKAQTAAGNGYIESVRHFVELQGIRTK